MKVDDLAPIVRRLEIINEKYDDELVEGKSNYFTQYTKGKIDAYEEILNYLRKIL